MKRFIYLIAFAGVMSLTACSDFLEEYSQDTSYVRNIEDLDELLLGSVYMPIAQPWNFAYDWYIGNTAVKDRQWFYPYIHVMGDEAKENLSGSGSSIYSETSHFFGYFTWQDQAGINPEGTAVSTESYDWEALYKFINVANMVIKKIDDLDVADNRQQDADRIKGEAYFLRGAYLFTLVNLYGKPYNPSTANADLGVPVKTSEFIEDKIFERATVQECYDQVLNDLLTAESLLTNTEKVSNFRADITAACHLLSRVYLYMQNWDKAAEYAQKVLSKNRSLQDLNTLAADENFLTARLPELIFTMGTGGMRHSIITTSGCYGISEDLVNAYADNDLRKTRFISLTANGWEYVKEATTNSDLSRSTPSGNFCFRTAEAYLNLAEAQACAGKDNEARQTLNTLRKARISTDAYTDVTASGTSLVNAIREERFRELCFEGHRWFDLRRYTVSAVAPMSKTIRHSYTTFNYAYDYSVWTYVNKPVMTLWYELAPNDPGYTLPIPREVLNFNLGMKDNDHPKRNVVETVNY